MKAVLAALAITLAAPAIAAMGERIYAPVGGISIEKPDGWYLIPPDESLRNLKALDFEDPRVQQSLTAALITLTRDHPDNVAGIIPTITIKYAAYPRIRERGAMGVTEDLIAAMRTAYSDFRVVEAPRPYSVAGHAGARALVVFTVRSQGGMESCEGELIIIPRGTIGVYSLALFWKAGEGAQTRAAFDAALASVRIDSK